MTTMTRETLGKRAASRGYTLHDSVTDERLALVNHRMLNGRPDRLTRQNAIYLDANIGDIERWIEEECYIASYSLGEVGDEVVAPPTTDEQLALVILPSFRVVAVVEGQGETTDGDESHPCSLMYTILGRPEK